MAVFTFSASLASLLSLFGWAAEKFLGYAPETLGIISFFVIGLIFIFALALLVIAYFHYDRLKGVQNDYILSHRITHYLRNSIADLQSLEFQTRKKIDNAELEKQFPDIQENDELKRKEIFKKLGAKITGSVAKQVKNYFLCNGLEGNVRITIKILNPDDTNDQLQWKVVTGIVDPETYNNRDRELQKIENAEHKIADNTDFQGILIGSEKCFSCNDLSGLPEDKYKNSSKDWRKRYNATLVVPIKNQPDGRRNIVYYGFLTADSHNPKKQKLFSSEDNAPVLNILAHAADALAVWFIKNDNHVDVIKAAIKAKRRDLSQPISNEISENVK